MKIKNNKKLKYGSIAAGLTCVCIALVVMFNAIFSAMAQRFSWFTDMTSEQVFELSPATEQLLEGYREKNGFEVNLIFCMEKDLLDSDYSMHLVHNMAQQFAEKFHFIHLEYINIELHPGAVEPYKNSANVPIDRTSVIIESGGRSVIRSLRSFFAYEQADASTPVAFDAEYKITAAILSIAGDNPVAYFTTGHGEAAENSSMYRLFEEAGFAVKTIDLSKEDPEEGAMVIVINNPKYDFAGYEQSVNEIEKLSRYLDRMGNLMVFMDTTVDTSRFTELNALLRDWGIAFEASRVYDLEHALSVDGSELIADYAKGSHIASDIRDMENPPKIVVKNARPLKALYDTNPDGNRKTGAILTTSQSGSATAVPFDAKDNEGGKQGIYPLMMTSTQQYYINNNDCYNYVLCAGSASFADDAYIGTTAYGNRDLIFSVMKSFGKQNVPIDLDLKFFDAEGLDLTTAQANRLTFILCAALPACVLAVGVVVYVRRRHL